VARRQFDLPAGAAHLAGSAAFPHQAFAWGSALALQFHLEARPDWVARLVRRDAGQLREGPYVQTADSVLDQTERLYRSNNLLLERLLEQWLEQRSGRQAPAQS
jgi:GMP synthase (glutamine-hydrolysing)